MLRLLTTNINSLTDRTCSTVVFVVMFTPPRQGSGVLRSVCLSVCPRAYLSNRWTDFVYRSPVAVARSSFGGFALLYVLPFMDDVTFDGNGPYGDVWKAEL